jgi:aldose 1-epimerase
MVTKRSSLLAFCCLAVLAAGGHSAALWAKDAPAAGKLSVVKAPFGALPDGTTIEKYTLTNAKGIEVAVITYGGVITTLKVPDRNGKLADIVLGYDNFETYAKSPTYFNAIIGRYANRIGKAQFTLDGKTYHLAANNNGNTLHGGLKGFDKRVWLAKQIEKADLVGVTLTRTSPDAEENFPGSVLVETTFTLNNANELAIEYKATADAPTVLNLTHHDYYNLAGEGSGDVLGHRLQINAEQFTPVDANLIPTGKLQSVANTPLDFRKPKLIGADIAKDDPLVKGPAGYDHNYVLKHNGADLVLAARVSDPKSGRVMEVRTTEPGVQLYTANKTSGVVGKSGHVYNAYSAFCLETQHYPDSPNHPEFPSTVLRPGQKFASRTVMTFSTE